ncbi:hypothetical protein [Streptomyces sp. NPDC057748]|uniref:hypothetical protein n=1 Tax=unclassified Streptomyces TaxID=2593676 RepID=UPI00369CFA0A
MARPVGDVDELAVLGTATELDVHVAGLLVGVVVVGAVHPPQGKCRLAAVKVGPGEAQVPILLSAVSEGPEWLRTL